MTIVDSIEVCLREIYSPGIDHTYIPCPDYLLETVATTAVEIALLTNTDCRVEYVENGDRVIFSRIP